MSAILHIFRTQPDIYQVDLSIGVNTYARTCTREELEHLMVTPGAFSDGLISDVFHELDARNNVTVSDVHIAEKLTSSLGFEPMPSDA